MTDIDNDDGQFHATTDDINRTKAAKTAENTNLICINQLLLKKPR